MDIIIHCTIEVCGSDVLIRHALPGATPPDEPTSTFAVPRAASSAQAQAILQRLAPWAAERYQAETDATLSTPKESRP